MWMTFVIAVGIIIVFTMVINRTFAASDGLSEHGVVVCMVAKS
jgi:hypothetical protein